MGSFFSQPKPPSPPLPPDDEPPRKKPRIESPPSSIIPHVARPPPVARPYKKRKVALFFGYLGDNYYGMQINPGVPTIEQTLLNALHATALISDANKDSLSRIFWMRSARTDKGVSAAGQCVSAKLYSHASWIENVDIVSSINRHLPSDIHMYGMMRATNSFNARSHCHRRRYEYIFPLRLLGGPNSPPSPSDTSDTRLHRFNQILCKYEGTNCFANFTEGLSADNASAIRFIIKVCCGDPFLPEGSGLWYVPVKIYGQSFLLHQIRKMIGLALAIYLGHAPPATIQVALSPKVRIPTPTAPPTGLLLDCLLFDGYNTRHKSNLEVPLTVDTFADDKESFKARIYSNIAQKEREDRRLQTWVQKCGELVQFTPEHVLELHNNSVKSEVLPISSVKSRTLD